MRFIGVDLHKNTFTTAYRTPGEEEPVIKTYKMNSLGLKDFIESLQSTDMVALETLCNTYYFVDEIKAYVKEVQIVNTRKFKIIKQSGKKTDKNDAKLIALYLEKGLLPTVRYQDKESRDLKSLITTRDKLVSIRSGIKNKIHALFMSNGINSQKKDIYNQKNIEAILTNYDISESNRFEITVLLQQIDILNENIKTLTKRVEQCGSKLENNENLISITGIGKLSSAILINGIGNIKDFQSEKALFSYFGIVPFVSDSGESVRHGHITKWGNRLLRKTLVQITFTAIRYNQFLSNYYKRKKTEKGAGKAIIATSRKVLKIIYDTLKNNWIFEDFNNFVLAS